MNDDVVHDSIPTAIAHQIVKLYAPDRMLEFLQAAQYARFVEGIDLTNWAAYVSIVKPFGITPKQFFDGFYNDSNIREATQTEFNYAHELMETVRAQGFPTILLINNGIPIQIPHGHLLKVPTDIVPKIQELLE
jgi:protein-disulfide isomerase-like protein with CxxC motif